MGEPASARAEEAARSRERVLIVGFLLILGLAGAFVVWPELGASEAAPHNSPQEGLAKKPAM